MKTHRVILLTLSVAGLAVFLGAQLFSSGRAQLTEIQRPNIVRALGNHTLKGSYSFSLHGFVGKSSAKPFGVSGVLNFDGAGKISGGSMIMRIQDQQPWSMTIQQPSTYVVKPDGTGSLSLRFMSSVSGNGRWELSTAVAKSGDKVFLNLTKAIYDIGLGEPPDNGDVATGEAVPQ